MPRLIVHGFTLSLGVGVLFSCSSADAVLDGEWSGRMVCRCQGQTMIDDGFEGTAHFEFSPGGVVRTWMDPKEEGAWSKDGMYQVDGDTLRVKHETASEWTSAWIVTMTRDSLVLEETPEKGCLCTSRLYRTKQH